MVNGELRPLRTTWLKAMDTIAGPDEGYTNAHLPKKHQLKGDGDDGYESDESVDPAMAAEEGMELGDESDDEGEDGATRASSHYGADMDEQGRPWVVPDGNDPGFDNAAFNPDLEPGIESKGKTVKGHTSVST